MFIYTVYETKNLINQKIYVGVHKTKNINDSYLGSGKYLKDAIKHYGRENFKKRILYQYDNASEAYNKEREIVNSEFVQRDDTYNISTGGCVSPDWIEERKVKQRNCVSGRNHPRFGIPLSEDHKAKISKSSKNRPKISEETRQKFSRSSKGRISPWKGKTQPIEANLKRSASHKKLEKLECPHCHKKTDPGNAKRHHFEKCKQNPNSAQSFHDARLIITCPHCKKVGTNLASMVRWHFNNCPLAGSG